MSEQDPSLIPNPALEASQLAANAQHEQHAAQTGPPNDELGKTNLRELSHDLIVKPFNGNCTVS